MPLRTRNVALATLLRDCVIEFAARAELPTRNVSITYEDDHEVSQFPSFLSE